MKKQGLLITCAILAALLFVACGSETDVLTFEDLSPARPLQIRSEPEGLVHMIATDVTSTDVIVTIQNNSDMERFTGDAYTLEAYYNGQWLNVPIIESEIPSAFSLIAWPIPPHDSISFTKDLSLFPTLGAELYRIRKDVDTHDVVAEFDWGR